MTVDDKATAIVEAVWRVRGALIADPRERGRSKALIVLVGFDLWADLRKRDEVDRPESPWRCRDGLVLLCVDAEVHPAEPLLVADADSWRLVRDLDVAG